MSSRLNLNDVRVLVSVARCGSFAAAGRQLGMPTSNVSRQVGALERALGLRLLTRQPDGLRPTEAGQALLQRFGAPLEGLDDFVDALRAEQPFMQGRLMITLASEVGPYLLGAALAEFALRHPDLEIRCISTFTGLQERHYTPDLAVIVGRGGLPDSDWVARPLAELPSVVVGAPALIARCGRPTTVQALTGLPCITTANILEGAPWRFLDAAGRSRTYSVQARIRLDSGALAMAAALKGVGYAILARAACEPYLRDGQLQALALDRQPAPLQLYAAYPQRRYLPRNVRELLSHLSAAVAHLRPERPRPPLARG